MHIIVEPQDGKGMGGTQVKLIICNWPTHPSYLMITLSTLMKFKCTCMHAHPHTCTHAHTHTQAHIYVT